MISRRTSSVPKEDVFPGLLYCDSRCSQTSRRPSEARRRHSQNCPQSSQNCPRRSQTCHRRSQVLPRAPTVLSSAPRCSQTHHNHSHGTPWPVIRDLSYSEGWPECPPWVWYTPDIDASKFTLHILSDPSGGSQRLIYILLMGISPYWLVHEPGTGLSLYYPMWEVASAYHFQDLLCACLKCYGPNDVLLRSSVPVLLYYLPVWAFS